MRYRLRLYEITNTFYFWPTLLYRMKNRTPSYDTTIENGIQHQYELCLFKYAISYEKKINI